MTELTQEAAASLTLAGRQRIKSFRQEIQSSVLHSWEWSTESFQSAMRWIMTHPHDIRRGIYLSDVPDREVWRLAIPERYGKREIVLKSYLTKQSMRQAFEVTEALTEATNYAVLETIGIPAAKLLACGEQRSFGCAVNSFIITEYIPNAFDGAELMPGGSLWEDQVLKLSFCRKALAMLARMHACQLYHRAFHPNKLVVGNGEDGDITVSLIDVGSLVFRSRGGNVNVARDLLTFFVDMRLSAEDIRSLCSYYLSRNPRCGFTTMGLWKMMVSLEESQQR